MSKAKKYTKEYVSNLSDEMLFLLLKMQPISTRLPKEQREVMERWLVEYGRVPTSSDFRKEKIQKFFKGIANMVRGKSGVSRGKNNQISK